MNLFWLDLAKHLIEKDGEFKGFLSQNFIYLNSIFTEIIIALSVIDLPYESPKIKQIDIVDKNCNKQKITSSEKCFLFCKEIKEGEK